MSRPTLRRVYSRLSGLEVNREERGGRVNGTPRHRTSLRYVRLPGFRLAELCGYDVLVAVDFDDKGAEESIVLPQEIGGQRVVFGNAESAAEIKRIDIHRGQPVHRGSLLIF